MKKTLAVLFSFLAFYVGDASAALDNTGILDSIFLQYQQASGGWATVFKEYAEYLFWGLVLISMIWNFGLLIIKGNGDLGSFATELIRMVIIVGFFYWLLLNGPEIAGAIINSLVQAGTEASGAGKNLAQSVNNLGDGVSPSGLVDIGFSLFDKAVEAMAIGGWGALGTNLLIGVICLIVLFIMALIAVNFLIMSIAAWLVVYGGVFLLGFGGSQISRDIVINYFKLALGVGLQLMTMILIIGIAEGALHNAIDTLGRTPLTLKDGSVMFFMAVIAYMLIEKVPPMIGGIPTGAGMGMGGGGIGSGSALAAAGVAAGAMAGGLGAAWDVGKTAAAEAGGVGSALAAAVSAGSANVAENSDVLANIGGSAADGLASAFDGGGGDSGGGISTPLSEASGSGGGSDIAGSSLPAPEAAGTGETGGSGDAGADGGSGSDGAGIAGAAGADGGSGNAKGSTEAGDSLDNAASAGGESDSADASSEASDSSGSAESDSEGGSSAGDGFYKGDAFSQANDSSATIAAATAGATAASGVKAAVSQAAKSSATVQGARVAADAVTQLAKGTGAAIKGGMDSKKAQLSERLDNTVGGKVAKAIKDLKKPDAKDDIAD